MQARLFALTAVLAATASLGFSQRAEALRPCYPCNVFYANCSPKGPDSNCESEYQECVARTCPETVSNTHPALLPQPTRLLQSHAEKSSPLLAAVK